MVNNHTTGTVISPVGLWPAHNLTETIISYMASYVRLNDNAFAQHTPITLHVIIIPGGSKRVETYSATGNPRAAETDIDQL